MKIGIFGGSFNPIHFGHLLPVSIIQEEYALDKVYFVVSCNPPHKDSSMLADGCKRLELTRLATNGNPFFFVSDVEFEENQPPYTVELLARFAALYPDDERYLIIGADSLKNLKSWFKWEMLFDRCDGVIAMARPGFDFDSVPDDLLKIAKIVETPLIDISSTEIRERISQGKHIKYYTPDSVIKFIEEHRLYLK